MTAYTWYFYFSYCYIFFHFRKIEQTCYSYQVSFLTNIQSGPLSSFYWPKTNHESLTDMQSSQTEVYHYMTFAVLLTVCNTAIKAVNLSIIYHTRWSDNTLHSFPVLAEKVSSLGKNWHRFCLKCERCSKILSAGGHAEVSKTKADIAYWDDIKEISLWSLCLSFLLSFYLFISLWISVFSSLNICVSLKICFDLIDQFDSSADDFDQRAQIGSQKIQYVLLLGLNASAEFLGVKAAHPQCCSLAGDHTSSNHWTDTDCRSSLSTSIWVPLIVLFSFYLVSFLVYIELTCVRVLPDTLGDIF